MLSPNNSGGEKTNNVCSSRPARKTSSINPPIIHTNASGVITCSTAASNILPVRSSLVSTSSSGLGSSGNVSVGAATPTGSRKSSNNATSTLAALTNPIAQMATSMNLGHAPGASFRENKFRKSKSPSPINQASNLSNASGGSTTGPQTPPFVSVMSSVPKLSLGSHLGPSEYSSSVTRYRRLNNETSTLHKCNSADESIILQPNTSAAIPENAKCAYPDVDIMFEEKEIVPGIRVRAANLAKLEEELMKSFDETTADEATDFVRVMLLIHKWFVPSTKLMMDIIERENNRDDTNERDTNKEFTRDKIVKLFKLWIEVYPMNFHQDNLLLQIVEQYADMLNSVGQPLLRHIIDLRINTCSKWSRSEKEVVPVTRKESDAQPKKSLFFNEIAPQELAEQLTVIEFHAFRQVTFSDLKNYATSGTLKDCPGLEKSISQFNGLSQWVQCMILNKTTPQERAIIIHKFVNISKELLKQQNFATFFAMVGGMTHSAITRLSKTTAALTQEVQKTIQDFVEILSSSNNFSVYRKLLQQSKGFYIPVLGVHLKDIVSYHVAFPNYETENLINFRKMAQIFSTFNMITECQYLTLPFEEDCNLGNIITLTLDINYTEEELYELSLAREPRNSSSPYNASKNVVFADWVSGMKPPNPNTVKKHVHDMVQAVFKVYDNDKDGFISKAEFDQIAQNFPFIDSFAVLDADNDGAISKIELKNYFIRANCHALRNSFKHDFHETTYFKPTYCAHCTGLLWGLIKQGWRCRVCSLNAHKHCKDLVVMECRSRHSSFNQKSLNSQELSSEYVSGKNTGNNSPAASPRVVHRSKAGRTNLSRPSRHSHAGSSFRQLSTPSSTSQGTSQLTIVTGSSSMNSSSPELTQSGRVDAVTQTCEELYDKSSSNDLVQPDSEIYEDASSLYDRLTITEKLKWKLPLALKERDSLLAENEFLKKQLNYQQSQARHWKLQVINIRQRTLGFVLSLMETLNIQKDSAV